MNFVQALNANRNINIFGNTLSLFDNTLKNWGLETRFVDMKSPESIENCIDDKTRAIFLESITNPQLEVADVKKISGIDEFF